MNNSYWSVKYEIAERCYSMHLPHELSLLLEREIKKWTEHAGEAWTVNRLKSLKMDLIRDQGGLPMLTWVKKNRFGETAGIIGSIFRFARKGPKEFLAALNSFMAYSAFKPGKPTEKHIESLHENLNAKPVETFKIPVNVRVSDVRDDEMTPFIFYSGCPSRKAPLFPKGSCPQSEDLQLEVSWFRSKGNRQFAIDHFSLYSPALLGLAPETEIRTRNSSLISQILPDPLGLERFQKSLMEEFPDLDLCYPDISYCSWSRCLPNQDGFYPPMKWDDVVSAGRIAGLDKDGGWKIRWVANPHRIHQHVLEPLKQRLLSLCHQLPWDCTHDQSKAIPSIQRRLKEGGQVHSVDLSSATDRFPLSFQEDILRDLNSSHRWQQYIDLFIDLSRCSWKFEDSWVKWCKGQPMGLGPSFPSFALAHGLLLDFLAGHKPGLFYILGDDVVILDDELNHLYIRVLTKWEVPISSSKSLSSPHVAEFGGSVITADYVFPMFKWKNIDDENFIEMMRLFGKKFSRMLTSRQRTVYEIVKSLQPPWGCAHEVKDRQKSEVDTAEFYERVREPESSTCWSFLRWFKSHKGLSELVSRSSKTLKQVRLAFDKKVNAALGNTLFPNTKYPEGFKSHFAAAGVGTRLPSLHKVPKTQSTLEIYEKILSTSSTPCFETSNQFEQKYNFLLPDIIRILERRRDGLG